MCTNTALAFNPNTTCPKLPEDPIKAQVLAGELFAKAEKDYAESRPLAALEGFLCSHHIIQHENTLFNIAQIAKVSDLKEQALQILKDYVSYAHGRNKTDAINDIISELDRGQADDEEREGMVAPLDTGESELPPETAETGDLDTGESELAQEAAATGDSAAEKGRRKKRLKVAAIALTATSGAALVSGGILQALAGVAAERANQTDDATVFAEEKNSMENLQTSAITVFIAGGVLLASGLTIFIVTRSEKSDTSPVSVSLSAAPDRMVITGRF